MARSHPSPESQASAVVRAVEVADAAGEGGQQLVGQRGHLVDDAREVALIDDQHRHVGVGGDRRGARAPVEQRELADDGARAEGGDLAPVALHCRRAVDDDERLAALLPLVGQCGAGLHGDLVRGLRDLLEVFRGAGREQGRVPGDRDTPAL